MNETQFQFLILLLGGIGAIVIIELFTISPRLNKIYDAIGVWGTTLQR